MKKLACAVSLALILASAPAFAKPEKYTFDPAHTQVMFQVDHIGFSHPHGRFDKFGGGFTFDAEHPEQSSIDVSIDTGSIDMASEDWNRAMKGGNFFNTDKFPKMTFKSTKIEKTGANTGKVTGDLTIIGVTKPVTLDVTYNKSGIHPYNKNYISGFSATGELSRSDFGMKWGAPGIGDKVKLDIQVEGIRQDFGSLNNK
jgi:polyisoprenoid-binding protein YceI